MVVWIPTVLYCSQTTCIVIGNACLYRPLQETSLKVPQTLLNKAVIKIEWSSTACKIEAYKKEAHVAGCTAACHIRQITLCFRMKFTIV